ncbi:MAG TPA: hypothetical protein VK929_12105 [Longimicrobiales bacterium]|nr:hypothetical protein [Longimicrobiales bacterium]
MRRAPFLLGVLILPACDPTDDPPSDVAPLVAAEGAHDEDARMAARVQGLTRAFQGDGSIADYVSLNAYAFNLQVLAEPADSVHPSGGEVHDGAGQTGVRRQADYWSIVAIRVPPEVEPTPVTVVRDAIAGMPPGMNTVSLLAGRPVVIHWLREDDEWMARSIQFYPPGPLADSLRNIVAGPGQPGAVP